MKKNLLIFTMYGCPHCISLKNRLNELNIDFIDVDVDSNDNIWQQVVNQTKQNIIPMIFFQNNDTNYGQIFIPGTDYQDEDEIIEIIKSEFGRD
jgi:glutaredoxin